MRIGKRDRRVVDPRTARAIRLLGSSEALDHGVDGLEVARVRRHGHLDLAGRGEARLRRREVVLDVARASLGIGDESVDRALALELAQDRRVGAADDVREDVQPPAMGDPDEHLVSACPRREPDRLVEHGNEHVEPFDGELLLSDERAPQVGLERLHPRQAAQELALLVGRELYPIPARLDGPPEPDALGVVRDVLDLVGDRAAVDLPQTRQRVAQRLTGDGQPKEPRRDARLEVGGERRLEPCLVEGGVPHRLGAERVETGIEMPVRAVRLDERHRGGDGSDQLAVRGGGRGLRHGRGRGGSRGSRPGAVAHL